MRLCHQVASRSGGRADRCLGSAGVPPSTDLAGTRTGKEPCTAVFLGAVGALSDGALAEPSRLPGDDVVTGRIAPGHAAALAARPAGRASTGPGPGSWI